MGHPRHPVNGKHHVQLVIYPGETKDADGTTLGHIYILNGRGESYEVAGGPPPSESDKTPEAGGHTRGVTPSGHFVLDEAEHHTTSNWPFSVVPWGAQVREQKGVIEYQVNGQWRDASGTHGNVTAAIRLWALRSGKHISVKEASDAAYSMFFDGGTLITEWKKNDFGKWSWNMRFKKNRQRSPYYIHTTPEDEKATAAGHAFQLTQSHGCVHLRPEDRDEMIRKGYLRQGVEVEVKPYGQVGPPK